MAVRSFSSIPHGFYGSVNSDTDRKHAVEHQVHLLGTLEGEVTIGGDLPEGSRLPKETTCLRRPPICFVSVRVPVDFHAGAASTTQSVRKRLFLSTAAYLSLIVCV